MNVDFDTVLETVRNEIDMKNTLSVLGIKVVKNAFLCPFHNDKHLGNCRIRHKDYAICFACDTGFDSIKLVQKVQNLEFRDAVIWLYMNVLGYPEPDMTKRNKTVLPLNYQEMKLIGVNGGQFAKILEEATEDEKGYLKHSLLQIAERKRSSEIKKRGMITRKSDYLKDVGLYQKYSKDNVDSLNKLNEIIKKIKK